MHLTWWNPSRNCSQSLGTTEALNLLEYASKNRSSPRVLAGTELQKIKKKPLQTPKIKPVTLQKLKP